MSNPTVMILCAGDSTRWNNHLGIPKQLIDLHGEPLLHRTVRLFGAQTSCNFTCVTRDSRLKVPGASTFSPQRCRWTVETLLSTRPLWTSRNIVLLGDVFYTRAAVSRILDFTGQICVFGRAWPSDYCKCDHGEIFAVSFSHDAFLKVVRSAEIALAATARGARGHLWDFYHVMCNLPLSSGRTEGYHFYPIDDLTNDFDSPEKYQAVIRRYSLATSPRPLDAIILKALLWLLTPRHLLYKLGRRKRPRPRFELPQKGRLAVTEAACGDGELSDNGGI